MSVCLYVCLSVCLSAFSSFKLLQTQPKSYQLGRAKRISYLSHMRAAKVQASLRIHAVSPEPPLLAHTSSESRGTFRQKARSLAPLNGWACAVKICHDGMLEDTNSLGGAQLFFLDCSNKILRSSFNLLYNLERFYWLEVYERQARLAQFYPLEGRKIVLSL